MAGVKGRSGRRRKTLEQHVLSGTYRPDRHGPLPKHLRDLRRGKSKAGAGAPDPSAAIVTPSALVVGLADTGRELVTSVLESFDVNPAGYALLRAAAQQADRATELRALIRVAGVRSKKGSPNPLLRVERGTVQLMVGCLRALGLPALAVRRPPPPAEVDPDDPWREFINGVDELSGKGRVN
jgi:hypothetical protein